MASWQKNTYQTGMCQPDLPRSLNPDANRDMFFCAYAFSKMNWYQAGMEYLKLLSCLLLTGKRSFKVIVEPEKIEEKKPNIDKCVR